jgi:Rps23 Pro-64 3,4-dihydroxylase Tpa1-like proline 4-hydroxylase
MVPRPRSLSGSPLPDTKRRKTISEPNGIIGNFHPSLLDEPSVVSLNAQYSASQPYKHAVIPKLFSDELLRNVKDEILENVSFTEKETDIYKVGHFMLPPGLSFMTT